MKLGPKSAATRRPSSGVWALLVLGLLGAREVRAQALVFRGAPPELRLIGRSDAVRIERLDATSQPLTTGALTVTVTAPAGAEVSTSTDPFFGWGASTPVTIGNGASLSAPVYFRAGVRGPVTWRASATGFTDATAVVLVRDDALTCTLETGTTLDTETPPGCFNVLIKPYMQSSIVASSAAARRGSFGLRLVDGESANGNAADTSLFDHGPPVFGDFHARTWVRFTTSNAQGSPIIAQFTNGTGLAPSLLDVKAKSDLTLALGGFGADAGYAETISDAGFTLGRWHLLEFSVTASGATDGGRHLFLDGRLVLTQTGIDFSGTSMPVARLALGEPYADGRRWLGTIDFDDVRTAAVPLASRVTVSIDDAGVGACATARVGLRSSFGDLPATLREETLISLDAGGAAQLFGDTTCGMPATTVSLPADASVQVFSLRAAGDTVTVAASSDDLLPTVQTFRFSAPVDAGTEDAGVDAGLTASDAGLPTPDAGLDAGLPPPDAGFEVPDAGVDPGDPLLLSVGCGCQVPAGAEFPLFALAALSLAWRSRKRSPN